METVAIILLAVVLLGLAVLLIWLLPVDSKTKPKLHTAGVAAIVLVVCLLFVILRDPFNDLIAGTAEPDSQDIATVQSDELLGRIMAGVDNSLATNPLFQALRETAPDKATEFEDNIRNLVRGYVADGRAIQFNDMAMMSTLMEQVLYPMVPQASDEAVIAFTRAMVDKMIELRAENPKYCVAFLMPTAFAEDEVPLSVLMSSFDAVSATLADVIRSAATDPRPIPSASEYGPVMEEVMVGLMPKLEADYGGQEMLAQYFMAMTTPESARNVNPDALSGLFIDIYEHVLALPDEQSGPLLRLMYSGAGG